MEKWYVAAKRADFQAIGEKFHIDQVIARIIRNRDVVGDEAIDEYLNGTLEHLHSPEWLVEESICFPYRRPAICIRIYWPIPIFP